MREPPSRAARLTGALMLLLGVLLFVRAFQAPYDPAPPPNTAETCNILAEVRKQRDRDPNLPAQLVRSEEMLRKYNQVEPVFLPTPCLEHP